MGNFDPETEGQLNDAFQAGSNGWEGGRGEKKRKEKKRKEKKRKKKQKQT